MKVLFTSVVILASVCTVMGIQCLVCNSEIDPACNDPIEANSTAIQKEFMQECKEENGTQAFCRKVKEHIYANNEIRVHRECGYLRREGYDCYQKRSEDYVMDVCQCDYDLCNDSPALTAPLTSLLAVAFPLLTRFM